MACFGPRLIVERELGVPWAQVGIQFAAASGSVTAGVAEQENGVEGRQS